MLRQKSIFAVLALFALCGCGGSDNSDSDKGVQPGGLEALSGGEKFEATGVSACGADEIPEGSSEFRFPNIYIRLDGRKGVLVSETGKCSDALFFELDGNNAMKVTEYKQFGQCESQEKSPENNSSVEKSGMNYSMGNLSLKGDYLYFSLPDGADDKCNAGDGRERMVFKR